MKAIVVIAHHGHKNDKHLERVLSEWNSMQGIEVEVIVLTDPGRDPLGMPFEARNELAKRLGEFDFYIFSEDDMLITQKNLEAWAKVTAAYMEQHEVAGFLRYEVTPEGERKFPDMHGHFHWEGPVIARNGEKFLQFSNAVAACYVLSGWQLRIALKSGGFLVGMHKDETYGYLERGSADPYLQCGLKRLICVSRFEEFLVHHLPNNYVHMGKPEAAVRAELQAMGVEWKPR